MSHASFEQQLEGSDTIGFLRPPRNADRLPATNGNAEKRATAAASRRLTPRKSFILVVPENQTIPQELLAEHLNGMNDQENVDVIVAFAGQPVSLHSLQRKIRDVQVLLAPAGTCPEDLRELAMARAPGDIVTLLSTSIRDAAGGQGHERIVQSVNTA